LLVAELLFDDGLDGDVVMVLVNLFLDGRRHGLSRTVRDCQHHVGSNVRESRVLLVMDASH
jgi:hypothetical protein